MLTDSEGYLTNFTYLLVPKVVQVWYNWVLYRAEFLPFLSMQFNEREKILKAV